MYIYFRASYILRTHRHHDPGFNSRNRKVPFFASPTSSLLPKAGHSEARFREASSPGTAEGRDVMGSCARRAPHSLPLELAKGQAAFQLHAAGLLKRWAPSKKEDASLGPEFFSEQM